MISILVCDRDERERGIIAQDCRRRVAEHSNEQLTMAGAASEKEFLALLNKDQLVHLLYYNFQAGQPILGLREFRRKYGDAMLMLIADAAVSPLEYLRPGVAPDALLLRPLNRKKLDTANGEFIESFLGRLQEKGGKESFLVDTREEKIYIPFSHIYYFEARDKKLFLRTKNTEYAFYDTIDALIDKLPDTYRRCHRSYIVNTEKIRRVLTAENYLDLGNQIGVPISRSYRAAFKGGRV